MAGKIVTAVLLFISVMPANKLLAESEVFQETRTKVVVRNLSASGKPYAVITDENSSEQAILPQLATLRPDYAMLDPHKKSKDFLYDGPVSDRKKIYLFAAGLAVTGAVTSVALPVAAVSGTGAAGGAGAYGAAGSAVAAGTLSTTWLKSRSDEKDNFKLESESRVITMPSDTEHSDKEGVLSEEEASPSN